MSSIDVYLGFFSTVSQIFNSIWLLASYRAYSDKFFDYKPFLSSLALSNFMFSAIYNWFLGIEVMFPLPAFKVTGFLKYLPDTPICRMFTIGIMISIANYSVLCTFEAITIRALVVYKKQPVVKLYQRNFRFILHSLSTLLTMFAGAALCFYDMGDEKVLNNEYNLNETDSENAIFAMTIREEQFHVLVLYSLIPMILLSIAMMITSFLVYPAALRRQNNLNNEMTNNEKPFTTMLVIQSLMPIVCIGSAFITIVISWQLKKNQDISLKYLPQVAWIFYPFINSISSLYLLEPYGRYASRLFGCSRRNTSVVPSIVIHGVDSAHQDPQQNSGLANNETFHQTSNNAELSSVVEPSVEPEQKELKDIELQTNQEVEGNLSSIVPDTSRRMSLTTEIIQHRQRRPSVFSRLSYFF